MEDEKGFKVIDKRVGLTENEDQPSTPAGEKQKTEASGPDQDEAGFPGLSFSTFLLSLSTSALVQLGELPDPLTNNKEINLDHAKQTINIMEILQDKTKGNLSQEEQRLIELLLYDLRMKFIASAGETR